VRITGRRTTAHGTPVPLNFQAGTIEYSSALAIPVPPTGGGTATASTAIATVQ